MAGDDLPKGPRLVFETRLAAAPETVRRALMVPEIRARWLPDAVLADPEPLPGSTATEVRYRMRADHGECVPSVVKFTVAADAAGGTLLRIVHARAALELPPAANGNLMMRAA